MTNEQKEEIVKDFRYFLKEYDIQITDRYPQSEPIDTTINFLLSKFDKLLTSQRESLVEKISNLTPFCIGVAQDPLISKDSVISIIKQDK